MKKNLFILFLLFFLSATLYAKTQEIEVECALCHIERLTKDNSLIDKRDIASASREMCYTCHDGSVTDTRNSMLGKGHSMSAIKSSRIIVPENLPLSKEKNIYCGTCHRPHEISKKKIEEPGFFRVSPELLCKSCHKDKSEEAVKTHFFGQKEGKPDAKFKGCLTCHVIHSQPDTTTITAQKDKSSSCIACHPDKDKLKNTSHNLINSAPGEKNILGKTTGETGLCGGCHLVHNGNSYMLWSKTLDPEKEKNVTLLCNSCHNNAGCAPKKQIGEIYHPVDINLIFTPQTKKRLTLLQNNTLTCTTCHDPHFDKKNFLRMENDQSELCVECHPEEKAVINTKHDISSASAKEVGSCAGCHLVHNAFDIKLWAKKINPGDDLVSTLCYSCHNKTGLAQNKLIGNYYHPLNIAILKLSLTTTLPLYTKDGIKLISGNITCSTCHNVHQWSPINNEEKQTSKENGTGENSFLRKTSNYYSELCSDCHKQEGFIAKTNHDMTLLQPYSVNIQGNKIEASGICSACHLVHNAADSNKWAKEIPKEGMLKDNLCLSCHNPNGAAKNSVIGENSHTLGKQISNNTPIRLPLYNSDGIIDQNGVIGCSTCHEPHLWDPEYFTKTDAKKMSKEEIKDAENEKYTEAQVDSAYIGEVVLIQGDYIYINLKENYTTEIGRIFSVIDEENTPITKVAVEQYNPQATKFKVFAKILSPETIASISEGDYVIDISLFLKAKISHGTGENSFLRIPNNNSLLCVECHTKEKSTIGTKHDLSINAPADQNSQGNTPLESGPCSSCHLAHNGNNIFLSAKTPKQNPDPASGICFTCHIKDGIASSKEIKYEWHHTNGLFSLAKPALKRPTAPLPFFDDKGAIKFDSGIVSCGTCHNPHQWNPENSGIISLEEGDTQNSFLRMKNNTNQLCSECHLSVKKKHMSRAASLSDTTEDEGISDYYGGNILTVNITSLQNNQIVNSPEQIVRCAVSDSTITTGTLILNEESHPLEIKDGILENKIKLKEGKNTIKVVVDKKGNSATSPLLTLTLDTVPLNIISYTYPKPVKISNEFKIKVIFNKTIDKNHPPTVTLIGNGRVCPIVERGGEIKDTYQTNDTYISPDITLDEEMAGEIIIAISDARDPAGNILKKTAEESFTLKTDKGFNLDKQGSIIIEEGDVISSPQINIKFNITDAEEMLITEDVTYKNSKWETFKPSKTFPLSNNEGIKTIYFKFKDSFGNISIPVTKTCTFALPVEKQNVSYLINTNLTLTKENSPYYFRGEVTVARDAVLTIQPGVTLLFSELKNQHVTNGKESIIIEKPALIIEGRLIAQGKKDEEIEFNVQSTSPQPGDWEGIIIKGAAFNKENIIEFSKINFARVGLTLDNSKAIVKNTYFLKNITGMSFINNSSLEMESSVIKNNKERGIFISKSSGNINKNEIVENKIGIFCDDVSTPSITNNYIMRNETGVNCQGGSSPQIANNIIMENTNIGLKIGFFSSPSIVGNLVAKNKNEGINIVDSSPLLYKNLIRDNKIGILCEKYYRKFLTQSNSIFNNKEFNFYLKNFDVDLDISNNWWGTDKPNFIELYFYDKNTDETLGQLIYQPILVTPILVESESNLALLDTQKPTIENSFLPQIVRITPGLRIKIELSESINPYIEPKLYIKNLSKGIDPLMLTNNWIFLDGKYPNSIILTPEIFLDNTMSGDNEVSIENIQDLSGNTIDMAKVGVFRLETNAGIKEGEITNKKEINIIFNNPEAKEIQISENSSFYEVEWIKYTEIIPFILSEPAGKKQIYARFKDSQDKISKGEELTINYDNTPPKIINSKIPEDINTLRSFRLKLFLDETLDINYKPKITIIINNKERIPISSEGGYAVSENGVNNVYFSPNIPLKDTLAGAISFEVEGAVDLAGNKMPVVSIPGFTYDIMPTEISSAVIKEGQYTNKKEIHILINANKAESIQVSENPSFPENRWIKFSNNLPFTLSSASGQKQIYIRIRDNEGNISKPITLKTNLDSTKPKVISYNYPKPVTLDSTFIISVTFDETMDSTIPPEIILISTGSENPVVPKGGFFSTSNEKTGLNNDTYTTPPIILKANMGGAITIVVKNAGDLASNVMDITSEETFQLDTFPPNLTNFSSERQYTNENNVNLQISAEDADSILLSEKETYNPADTTSEWRSYIDYTSFSLSEGQGKKKIYLRLKDSIGNISNAFKTEVILDKTRPQILFYKFQYNPGNSSLTISFVFSESIDTSREPQISFIGSGKITPNITAGGTFSTILMQNDTYTTAPITLKEDMTGEIIIVVNEAYDMAGNSISTTARASFFYSPIFPVITSIIPMEENFTYNPWVNLFIYAYDAKSIMISEDPSFSKNAWLEFSENIQFKLSESPGEKTIYFKSKDAKGNISYVTNINIEKIPPTKDFIQNSNKIEIPPKDTTTTQEIKIKSIFENFTYQMVSENPFLINAKWEPYKPESSFVLSQGHGNKVIYFWFKDDVGNYSDIFSKNIFFNAQGSSGKKVEEEKTSVMQKVTDFSSNLSGKTIDVTQKVVNIPFEAARKVAQAILPSQTDTTKLDAPADQAKFPDTAKVEENTKEMAVAMPGKTIDVTQKVVNIPFEAVRKITQAILPPRTDTVKLDTSAAETKIPDTTITETKKEALAVIPGEIIDTTQKIVSAPIIAVNKTTQPVLPPKTDTLRLDTFTVETKITDTTTIAIDSLKTVTTSSADVIKQKAYETDTIQLKNTSSPKKIKQIWSIQITSNQDKELSVNFMDKINSNNSHNYAYIKKVIINGTIWYNVQAGLFNDEKDAEEHGVSLKRQFPEIKKYTIVPIK